MKLQFETKLYATSLAFNRCIVVMISVFLPNFGFPIFWGSCADFWRGEGMVHIQRIMASHMCFRPQEQKRQI